MDKIEAKSIVNNEFWILRKDNNKIGEIIKNQNNKIEVKVYGNKKQYDSIAKVKETGLYNFTDIPVTINNISSNVYGFPTDTLAYNPVWNVTYKLPLYNQDNITKTWHAAGYYKVNINGTWIVQFCPKLLFLQRYEYTGPFRSDPGLNTFKDFFE